jgi:aminopeptidase YwaD
MINTSIFRLWLFTLSIIQVNVLLSQRDYGLKVVHELCEDRYHGRGYVNDGHTLAATYIAQEMATFGIMPLTKKSGYYQYFDMDVNTFPGEVTLVVGKDTLFPGRDYIIDPKSGGSKGDYTLVYIKSLHQLDSLVTSVKLNKTTEQILPAIFEPATNDVDTVGRYREYRSYLAHYFPVLWITSKKLTYSVGREAMNNTVFEVKRGVFDSTALFAHVHVDQKMIPSLRSQNVIGYLEGKKSKKTILISAHYDHLGRMGQNTYFPGANDNASGVAMLLALARYYAQYKPPCNLVFIAFGGEEAGLVGSRYYVENPVHPLEKTHFVLNIDIMGTGEDGITVVNGVVFKSQFLLLSKINQKKNYLKKIQIRGKAANSDHYWFSEKGVPAFFVYTMGGVSFYHDIYDKSETLPLNEFDNLFKLFTAFINKV